jgi:hypothetical protein
MAIAPKPMHVLILFFIGSSPWFCSLRKKARGIVPLLHPAASMPPQSHFSLYPATHACHPAILNAQSRNMKPLFREARRLILALQRVISGSVHAGRTHCTEQNRRVPEASPIFLGVIPAWCHAK